MYILGVILAGAKVLSFRINHVWEEYKDALKKGQKYLKCFVQRINRILLVLVFEIGKQFRKHFWECKIKGQSNLLINTMYQVAVF